MARPESLGQFEQIVLTAVLVLGEKAYGVTIHEKVEQFSGRPVSLGAVYITLDRLEDKGFIASWLSDPTRQRGGRSKRCYQLKALGEKALQESALTAKRICDVIEDIWGADLWNPRRPKWNPVRPK
jgi:DNA-binding PadR family transcriptional regulator